MFVESCRKQTLKKENKQEKKITHISKSIWPIIYIYIYRCMVGVHMLDSSFSVQKLKYDVFYQNSLGCLKKYMGMILQNLALYRFRI